GHSPLPTYSWRMCCAWSIGSTVWRDIPPVVTMSRAPRAAPRSRRHTQTRWRILLRRTEQHRRQKLTVAKPTLGGLTNPSEQLLSNQQRKAARARLRRSCVPACHSAPVLKVEKNLFAGYDVRREDGTVERGESKASGETECRVVEKGRGN